MYSTLLTEIDEAIGLITLNRPERQNALDATLVAELIDALLEFQARPAVRVVVLSASGLAFCAGIDPAWLRHSEAQGEAAGMRDERLLAQLLTTLNELPKPTLARVQGPAYGAGIGLIAACDLAVASEEANFLFNDIRQGRIAASSAPFFLAAVGARQGRRYLLGGERFSAIEAYRKAAPLDERGESYLNLAKVLANEGRLPEAKQAAQQALDKGIRSPDEAKRILDRKN